MDLFDTTQIALERAVQGASLRQATLADNLANANTPGFRRRDVDFHSVLREALGSGKPAVESASLSASLDPSPALRADGSNVDVDKEASQLAQAGLEHEAAVTAASARIQILRAAMGVG